MKNYTKTTIRLQRVAAKQAKTSYKHLGSEEKKLIKILETLAQNETDTNKFWRYIKRDQNNVAVLDNKESEIFQFLEDQRKSCYKKQERITEKNNWTDEKINQIWRLHQESNCHSQSY